MEREGAGGEAKPERARNLQPPSLPDLGAPVSEDDLHQTDGEHDREALRLRRNLDRRLGDKLLLVALAQEGFTGPRYDLFAEEIARYGISVLRGWLYSGYIFHLVAGRGYALNPHELELEELARDSELRGDLANMTVARALPRFRQRAFVEGGWTQGGGASITTYFMGACAYDFPNEFRRHRASRARHQRATERCQAVCDPHVSPYDLANEVVGNLRVIEEIGGIEDPRLQAAVALTLDGYGQEEIREMLDARSVRAVEGLLYRWRTKAKRKVEK